MYADPAHIRNRRVNLSLSEVEDRMAEAAAEFNGMQKSAFLRELIIESLERMHGVNSSSDAIEKRAVHS